MAASIGSHDEVVLACHVGPDGDALGSMLALGLALRARGHDGAARRWGSEPFEVPCSYAGLPGLDLLVPASELPAAPGAARHLRHRQRRPARRRSRPGRQRRAQVLVIDHHASNTRFGTRQRRRRAGRRDRGRRGRAAGPAGPAADRRDRRLRSTPAWSPTPARSSTPRRRPRCTSWRPGCWRPASGTTVISREIWDTASFGYVKLLGSGAAPGRCSRPRPSAGSGLVWTAVSADDLHRYDLALSDVEGVIDVLRTTRGGRGRGRRQDRPGGRAGSRSRPARRG